MSACRYHSGKRFLLEQETALLKEKLTGSREMLPERLIKDLTGSWMHSDELLDSWRHLAARV
ncbi:hypothetical protein [Paenibacillus sp. FSL R7-277]|uniref:hypothetical protein n=1 Tax=Paenibacillus sp. FSL R7-277 TaxID=1227352 RepID=UPI0004B76F57|nr:hypothetical protein [Paenibacillus sp. FSL R7-277]